jgi:hypothetical protein
LSNWLAKPARDAVENTEELKTLSNRFVWTPGHGQSLSSWHIATALLYRLFAQASPAEIASDMMDFALLSHCRTCTYVGLHGGGITNEIEIEKHVLVTLAEKSPPSSAREFVFGIDRNGRPEFSFRRPPEFRPNIALLVYGDVEVFRDADDFRPEELRQVAETIERSIWALTLSSGFPFVRAWQTSCIIHPAIPYEGFGGSGGSGSMEQQPIPQSKDRRPVDPALARGVYSQFLRRNPEISSPIILATERLRRSRVHAPSADTAIDLGIAGEITVIAIHDAAPQAQQSRFANGNSSWMRGS